MTTPTEIAAAVLLTAMKIVVGFATGSIGILSEATPLRHRPRGRHRDLVGRSRFREAGRPRPSLRARQDRELFGSFRDGAAPRHLRLDIDRKSTRLNSSH